MSHPFLRAPQLAGLSIALCALQAFAGPRAAFCAGSQEAGGIASPGQTPAVPQGQSPPTGSESKKPKKVWTNDDLGNSGGRAQSSADPENRPANKPISAKSPNAQYAANLRKQIDKLQKQLADTDQQLADLKKFKDGESPGGNMQLHKRYNMVPIDQQITDLQEKKKRIQAQLNALFDDARRKGIEPGQLR